MCQDFPAGNPLKISIGFLWGFHRRKFNISGGDLAKICSTTVYDAIHFFRIMRCPLIPGKVMIVSTRVFRKNKKFYLPLFTTVDHWSK